MRYFCYSCWFFSVLNNAYIPMNASGPQKRHNGTDSKGKWIWSLSVVSVGISLLRFAQDILFISIMIWTSFLYDDSPEETPPENALYTQPQSEAQSLCWDQSIPHYNHAGGHICDFLSSRLYLYFLSHFFCEHSFMGEVCQRSSDCKLAHRFSLAVDL